MSEMIDIVTAALKADMCRQMDGKPLPDYNEGSTDWSATGNGEISITDLARAAIEAMREPTEEMIKAGACAMSAAMPHGADQSAVIYGQPKDIFKAMTAAALKEGG